MFILTSSLTALKNCKMLLKKCIVVIINKYHLFICG